MASEYLDPVVAVLGGDSAAYLAMLTEAETRMEAFVAATTAQIAELDATMATLGAGGAGESGAAAAAAAEAGGVAGAAGASAAAAEQEAAAARIVAADTAIAASAETTAVAEESAEARLVAALEAVVLATAETASSVTVADALVAASAARTAAEEEAAAERIVASAAATTAAVEAETARLAATPITIANAADTAASEYALAMDKMRADTAKLLVSFEAAEAKATESTVAMGTKIDAAAAESTATTAGKVNAASSMIGTFAATVGIAAAAESVKMAGNFEQATNRLMTAAGETKQNIGSVGDGILAMAGQVGFTAQQLAQAMYTVDSASFHGADSLTILKAAAQGAKIEQADLGTTVDAVTTSLVDYHLGADQAATVMSKLVTAVGEGKTNLQDLAGSLHSVTPLAANLGISLDEVTAAVATMTVHGMGADQATQNLADTIRHLSNPTQTMISEMGQLGLSSQTLSKDLSDPSVGLHGVLDQIYTTIMRNMGPAGNVLLNSFKQSASAGQDLNTMLSAMPAQLKTVAQGLSNGSIDTAAYNKQIKAMPDDLYSLGKQFETLHEKSTGFNDALKSGSPSVQTFEAALAKIMGDSTGLNTALMLGGENAATFGKNIDAVSKAAGDGQGNVKNWSDVENSLNQQLSDTEGAASSLAVEVGRDLLPVVTGFFKDLNSNSKDGSKSVDNLGDSFKNADDWVRKATKSVNDFGQVLYDALHGQKDNTIDGIGQGLLSSLGIVDTSIDDIHKQFVEAASNSHKDGIAVGSKFADGVSGTTPQVVDAAGKLVQGITGPLGLLTGTMYPDGAFAGNRFADGVLSATPQVDYSAGQLVYHLGGPLGMFTGTAYVFGSDSGSKFANGVQSTLPQVDSSAGSLVTGAKGSLNNLPGSAFQAGAAGGFSFSNGLLSPLPQVDSTAGKIVSTVTGPLGILTGSAYGSGITIGANLASGLNSQVGNVGAAAGHLASAVRDRLPSSPAKKGPLSGSGSPDILGRNISTMVAAGILQGHGAVGQAMSSVLGAPSAGAGGYSTASAPGFSGGAGGGLTVNLTVNGSLIQQQDLRRFVQDLFLQHDARNNSNGLSGVIA